MGRHDDHTALPKVRPNPLDPLQNEVPGRIGEAEPGAQGSDYGPQVSRDLLRADVPGDSSARRGCGASMADIGQYDVAALRQHAGKATDACQRAPDRPGDQPGDAGQRVEGGNDRPIDMAAATLGVQIQSGRGHERSHQANSKALVASGR
jgi:hypothetical protein